MKVTRPATLSRVLAAGTSLVLLTASASAATYSQAFELPDGTNDVGGGTALTNGGGTPATIQGGALELTRAGVGSSQNSFNVPGLAGSSQGFTISFDLTIVDVADGTSPADGMSVNYGNFGTAANYGEEGAGGTSLAWVIDTWNNTEPGTIPNQGIRSKINGVNDFVNIFAPVADGETMSHFVTLSWNPTSGMSMAFDGNAVFSNRPTPGFVPDDSFAFGFGARTGGATETVLIDNLEISTVPEPGSTLLAGAAGLGLLLRRRRK